MVEMKDAVALISVFMIISMTSVLPLADAERYVVNEPYSDYDFRYRQVVQSTSPQYFIIEGSRNMQVSIDISVEGCVLDSHEVSAYLVPGNYTLPENETVPENYDKRHSQTVPADDFIIGFTMKDTTEYTLVVIPNGSSAFIVEIEGKNYDASVGISSAICLTLVLIALGVFLVFFRYIINGKTRPPKHARFRNKEKKEKKEDMDRPYEVR